MSCLLLVLLFDSKSLWKQKHVYNLIQDFKAVRFWFKRIKIEQNISACYFSDVLIIWVIHLFFNNSLRIIFFRYKRMSAFINSLSVWSFQGTCLCLHTPAITSLCFAAVLSAMYMQNFLMQFLLRETLSAHASLIKQIRQPPAFPGRLQPSIIGRQGLNHRVRDGYGCFPLPHRHRKSFFVTIFFYDNSTVK